MRSPIISTEASCRNGTLAYSEATDGSALGCRRAGSSPATRSATSRMCSGVVPQQPPTRLVPNSVTNEASEVASSSGVSGYQAPFGPSCGRPAFGITDRPILACWDR